MQFKDKKKLVQRASKLKDYQYVHLFDIVRTDTNCKYSENKNGVFINMNILSDDTLQLMDNYISLIESKNMYDIETLENTINDSETQHTKLNYETIYHDCYKNLSNFHKRIVKNQGNIPKQD